eukprot:6845366-Alexandrium_andersonii.AAC.1
MQNRRHSSQRRQGSESGCHVQHPERVEAGRRVLHNFAQPVFGQSESRGAAPAGKGISGSPAVRNACGLPAASAGPLP